MLAPLYKPAGLASTRTWASTTSFRGRRSSDSSSSAPAHGSASARCSPCWPSPVVWLIYTLLRGLLLLQPPPEAPSTTLGEPQHWYPYPFIDVNDPSPLIQGLEYGGYAGVSVNIVAIVILGLVFGFLFLGLDRALSRGRKPTPL